MEQSNELKGKHLRKVSPSSMVTAFSLSSQNTILKSGWKTVIVNNVIMLTLKYGLFNELLNEIHPLVLPVNVGLLLP